MRSTAIVGVVLILLGVAALVYQGITYTGRETVVDVGPLELQIDARIAIDLPLALEVADAAVEEDDLGQRQDGAVVVFRGPRGISARRLGLGGRVERHKHSDEGHAEHAPKRQQGATHEKETSE